MIRAWLGGSIKHETLTELQRNTSQISDLKFLYNFSLNFFSQILQSIHISLPNSSFGSITDQDWRKIQEDSCTLEQLEAWSSSMVKAKFCWIKDNWTSRPIPINSTSLLEDHLCIARPETREFQSCTSRGHEIVSLNSHFCYVNVVDHVVVVILSFDSLNSMPYSLSFDDLKFWWWIMICSIQLIHDVKCYFIAWFMT
jgi:hypothetical protein